MLYEPDILGHKSKKEHITIIIIIQNLESNLVENAGEEAEEQEEEGKRSRGGIRRIGIIKGTNNICRERTQGNSIGANTI